MTQNISSMILPEYMEIPVYKNLTTITVNRVLGHLWDFCCGIINTYVNYKLWQQTYHQVMKPLVYLTTGGFFPPF